MYVAWFKTLALALYLSAKMQTKKNLLLDVQNNFRSIGSIS